MYHSGSSKINYGKKVTMINLLITTLIFLNSLDVPDLDSSTEKTEDKSAQQSRTRATNVSYWT